ncbi:MAG: tyrosine-protein phosphatase [Clostridia bacterium]
MVDTHSHIVYNVDDGAKTIQDSVQMLKEAQKAGFTDVILTPHYMETYYEVETEQIQENIREIQAELERQEIAINLYQGNEIYVTSDMNTLIETKKATTLNQTRYLLFELPMNTECLNLTEVVYQILSVGKIPIIAHPERYEWVQKDPNRLIPFIEDGVLFQSNYGSVLGQYGKKCKDTIKIALQHQMIHFLGSDVHRANHIYLKIEEATEEIQKWIGKEAFVELSTSNPMCIIKDEPIDIKKALIYKETWFTKFFNK